MPITLDGTLGITTPSYGGADAAEYLVPVTGFKNRIINGAMTIDQRNAGAEINPAVNNTYSVDRWNTNSSVGNIYKIQQNAGSVTPPAGFTNYLGVTTVNTISVSGTNSFTLNQRIEGLNVADLGWGTADAKTVTLSFWVRSSLTGTFGGALSNGSLNRSYPYSYTISAANTWEYKTITISGDTTGTWATNNTTGIFLWFGMGVGGTLSGSAGSWAGSDFRSATGATSVVGTNGATFYITGVQLEVGTVATSFDYRPYGTELMLCQRYFFQLSSTNAGNGQNTGITGHSNGANELQRTNMSLPVTMRAVPTISVSNVKGNGTDLRVYNGASVQTVNALGAQFSTVNYLQADWTLSGNFSPTGQYLSVLWQDNVNGGWIRASAEL